MLVGFVEYHRSLRKEKKEKKEKGKGENREFLRSVYAFFISFLSIFEAKLREELS